MKNLYKAYEINAELQSLLDSGVDEETGELTIDTEQLLALQIERDKLCEGLALDCKDMRNAIEGAKSEKEKLSKRIETMEKNLTAMKTALQTILGGEKFKTNLCNVYYQTRQSVELDADFVKWAQEHNDSLLRYKEPEPDKTAIKEALLNGEKIDGAKLVDSTSMAIR